MRFILSFSLFLINPFPSKRVADSNSELHCIKSSPHQKSYTFPFKQTFKYLKSIWQHMVKVGLFPCSNADLSDELISGVLILPIQWKRALFCADWYFDACDYALHCCHDCDWDALIQVCKRTNSIAPPEIYLTACRISCMQV